MREQHTFKVVVAGPFAAGKSSLLRAVSTSPVVGTEQPTSGAESGVKATTTVGVEHGTYEVVDDDLVIHLSLHGVPGQQRFEFMWDIVGKGMDGLLLLVDPTDVATWDEAAGVLRHFASRWPGPVVVGATRPAPGHVLLDLAEALGPPRPEVLTCDVRDPRSARLILVALLAQVLGDDLDELAEAGST
jgi:signal recognition particle receptor subunit beta